MYNKKFVASFMTALMAAMTLVSPALGATALNTYPTFLGKVGDFYVVVGTAAAASDVAGAIDIAANLAQLSYKETTTTGTTTTGLTGVERKVAISASADGSAIGGTGANNLPSVLRNFHYSGLKEGQFEFRGTKYNYHESVVLPTTGTALTLTHMLSSPVNGTLKMRLDQGGITYKYTFDTAVAGGYIPTSANSTSYATPLKVTVAGREFQIVAIQSVSSFDALVGTVKTLSDGESLTAGDLTFKVVQSFSSTTAKIEITDSSGNVVKSGINTGTTESVSYGGATYNYKVLSSGATASGVPGYAQLLAGKGDIEKRMDGGTEAIVSEWGADWKIGAQFVGAAPAIAVGDNITVTYNPASITDTQRYNPAGTVVKGPGGYFELKYAGYTPDKFAKLTIEPSGTVTLYSSTASTGYATDSVSGLKFSTDVSGTLVSGSTGYGEMYLLFNESDQASNFNNTEFVVAYKDKATGRVINSTQPTAINGTSTSWTLTLSYGGPGATATFTLNGTLSDMRLATGIDIYNSSARQVSINYTNRTVSSTSSTPELMLGANAGTADANDVRATVEGVTTQDVSAQVFDLITDGGVQVYAVKSNTETNKVIIGIPPETVYGLVQFGKIGEAAAAAGTTVKEVVAITTAVAKLDSEVTSADKTGKSLVLVGGPCKNTLVADLKTAGKFAYGCTDWPASNFGRIQVVDDAFATGKKAVVVAGTRAEDTRLASSVLQSYATKLSAITNSTVDVTGTVLATATITAK